MHYSGLACICKYGVKMGTRSFN